MENPRCRTANRRQAAPVVMPEMVDVREFHGIAPLWGFIEDVEDDTAPPKPKKRKVVDAASQARLPVKALPMQPTPLPAPAPRVSPLERTRREGLGYDDVYVGKRAKKARRKVERALTA
jgi:hypothetical protein